METNFYDETFNRRNFFRLSAGAAAGLALMNLAPKPFMGSGMSKGFAQITLQECMKLTPAAIAEASTAVKQGHEYLLKNCKFIKDERVRGIIIEGLNRPVPKLVELYPSDEEKETVWKKLSAAGYIAAGAGFEQLLPPHQGPAVNLQPFITAPGSGWKGHHAYPGGLVSHVAVDLRIALGICEAYHDFYGYDVNRELLISAIMLHDIQKTWVLQWQDDLSCRPEQVVAGTGVHHILAIADAIHRRLPAELIVAIACSHEHPGRPATEAMVVNWLKAAAIMAWQDPIKLGVLAADGMSLPNPRRQEGFLVHLGDHDVVLTSATAGWMTAKLKEIAVQEYKMDEGDINGKPFHALRNYVFSQAGYMKLHQLWVEQGEKALREMICSIVTA